ncbi:amidase family protein [Corynebacterium variabile]|uniref:amidase family protein n=1 Tax=Corynebacterium variabile TaxID=1727 RepID=UPI0028EFC148|nr:amidase family protein [Corynebacterium variabile]
MTDQQSLVEIAAEKITEEILAGSLRPGDRVSEPRVSESLGMSRPPLREALRVLETRGLLTHLPRRGYRVVEMSGEDMAEIYDLRHALERFALDRILHAAAGSPRSMATILGPTRSWLRRMEKAASAGNPVAFTRTNIGFHTAVVDAAENGRLSGIYRQLMVQMQLWMSRNLTEEAAEHGDLLHGYRRHVDLLAAMETADPAVAYREFEHHGERSWLDGRNGPGDLRTLSAGEIAEGVRSRRFTARSVIEATRRLYAVSQDVNAFLSTGFEEALDRADTLDRRIAAGHDVRPLAGVPVSVKDVIAVAGLPVTAASRAFHGETAFVTASVVRRLEDAGAIVIGKTNCPEFAFGVTCTSPEGGTTRNPLADGLGLDLTPGGSSGGEAASLAAGLSALGVGTDFGGSIRWPAQCTGIVGLRPTAPALVDGGAVDGAGGIGDAGTVPMDGQVPGAGGAMGIVPGETVVPADSCQGLLQVPGPMARTVSDLATAWEVMSGAPVVDPVEPLRIAWSTGEEIQVVGEAVAAAVASAAERLDGAGHTVVERPDVFTGLLGPYNAWRDAEPLSDHRAAVREREALLAADTRASLEVEPGDPEGAVDARAAALEARAVALEVFDEVDLVVLPVAPGPACGPDGTMTVGGTDGVELAGWELMFHCRAVTLTGCPVVSVPVATDPASGMPLSVQLVAAPGREDVALAVALELESAVQGAETEPDSVGVAG